MIRYFEEKDRQQFMAFSRVFHGSEAVLFKVGEENFHKTFDLALERSPYVEGYMIEQDGQAAGFALLTFSYSNEMGGMIVWLEELYIDDKFQGQGLGNEFLDYLENQWKGKACYIRLEVTDSNKGAIKLYEKRGYQILTYRQMVKLL